jgi:signal transduction histidine kinase
MRELIAKVLEFSRRPNVLTCRGSVDIGQAVRSALTIVRPVVPSTVEVRESIEDRIGIVAAERGQIETIVVNLVSNAVHAMAGTMGRLEVTLAPLAAETAGLELPRELPPGRYACLTVSDTGHGMDEATIRRIFEPFFTTKQVGEGTGLGLSIIQNIIRTLGGAVAVTSTAGTGTRFDVYLPVKV